MLVTDEHAVETIGGPRLLKNFILLLGSTER